MTCWHSGNRTYYGNVFYYQMDGNNNHNAIVVDFVKEGDLTTGMVNLNLSVYENQVNLRNSSASAEQVPLTDMQFSVTSNETYQGMTDGRGNAVIKSFKGVIGGVYSMILYQPGRAGTGTWNLSIRGNRPVVFVYLLLPECPPIRTGLPQELMELRPTRVILI